MIALRRRQRAAADEVDAAPAVSVSPDDVVRDSALGRPQSHLDDAPVHAQDLDMSRPLVTQIRTLLAQH